MRDTPEAPAPTIVAQIPRLLLKREEAASALAMSVDSFDRYVEPGLRLIRKGRMVLVPVGELERWITDNQEGLVSGPRA